jgi:hypothetical protein
MQNRKSADADIIVGWNVGTVTQCAAFIGNIPAKPLSAAAAGWNTFQTISLPPLQSERLIRQGANQVKS